MIDNFLMEIPKGHSAELEEVNESRIIHTAVPAVPFVGTGQIVTEFFFEKFSKSGKFFLLEAQKRKIRQFS